MRFIDVCGPPGVGKSTLCDRDWAPRSIRWDGKIHPREWDQFVACTESLLKKVRGHPSYARCRAMVDRSFRKMAAVHRMEDDRIYVQTGFAQRGLGIGWRLDNPEDIAEYFRLMPVSLGVVFLTGDIEVIQRRNVERGKDRSHMVPLMKRPQEIAIGVLRERGVNLLELDTVRSLAATRADLKKFVASVAK